MGSAVHGRAVQLPLLAHVPNEHTKLTVALMKPALHLAVHMLPDACGKESAAQGESPVVKSMLGTAAGAVRHGLAVQMAPPVHLPPVHV